MAHCRTSRQIMTQCLADDCIVQFVFTIKFYQILFFLYCLKRPDQILMLQCHIQMRHSF